MDELEVIKTVIAGVTASGALIGGAIALVNVRNSIRWKRAELASSHLQALNSNEELVFACRALDWNGGLLAVPQQLRPLLQPDGNIQVIVHDPIVMKKAMRPDLTIAEMQQDARIQLYRTAMDSLLSWLSIVAQALDRNLFEAADIEPVAYWLSQIDRADFMKGFITAFDYDTDIDNLRRAFQPFLPAYGSTHSGAANLARDA